MPLLRMCFLAIVLAVTSAFPQTTHTIDPGRIRDHLKFLTSPELEGRATGSEGNRKAAAYIQHAMEQYGLSPAGDSGSYGQTFRFIQGVRAGEGNRLDITASGTPATRRSFALQQDFVPLSFSSDTSLTAPLVFAGYGITAPDTNYDDYAGIDVTGKIVVVLRYAPDGYNQQGAFARHTSLRNKARVAREHGAAAIIYLTGPRDSESDDLIAMGADRNFDISGIAAFSAKRGLFDSLLAQSSSSLLKVQREITATGRPVSFAFSGVEATIRSSVIRIEGTSANIVGVLHGNDPVLKSEYVLVGAHFDHLGYGGPGSGSMKPDTNAIHPGADDNGSGTSGLLELMRYMSGKQAELRRSVVFLFFSGEELGTLGSLHFADHPTLPLSQSVAMINMDMIGRLRDRALTVYGTGTSPAWVPLLHRLNRDSGFVLTEVADGFGPSDHASFYARKMPVLFFFTGYHDDYHRPSDTWEKINCEGEAAVVHYVAGITEWADTTAQRPPYARTTGTQTASSGDMRSFSVTLGIVPDVTGNTTGVKITGVRPDGPAEKAGLRSGDVIVNLAGKKILSIYDYMGVLGELKAGDVVDVEALRDGKSIFCRATMQRRR